MTEEYRLEKEDAVALGYPTSNAAKPRFMVKAGSTAMVHGSPAQKREGPLRDELVRKGILALHPANSDLYVFQRDFEFTSASAAGGVISDGNLSGPGRWKNIRTGKSLKDDLR